MKKIEIELKSANRRADNSVSFKTDTLVEISSKEFGEIDSYRGCVGLLILTDTLIGNELNLDIDNILDDPVDRDIYDNHKTPSQRLRNVLYVQCEQKLGKKPTKEEFADYYKRSIEAIINKIKATLDQV